MNAECPATTPARAVKGVWLQCCTIVLVLAFAPAQAMEPLTLDDARDRQVPGERLELLRDPKGQLAIDDLIATEHDWSPSRDGRVNLGLSKDHWWFRLQVHNPSPNPERRLLEIAYPSLDQVDVYAVENGEVVSSFRMGDHQPFHERPVEHRFFVVPLQWPADTTRTLYLNVSSSGPLQVPLTLWQEAPFFTHAETYQMTAGLFFGAMLIMGLYNFFIYLGLRERAHIHYVIHLFSLMLFVAAITGYGFQYLWPGAVDWNERSIGFFLTLATVFGLLFTRDFLRLKTRYNTPLIKTVLFIAYGLYTTMVLTVVFAPYTVMLITVVSGAVLTCAGAFLVGGYTWWHGEQSARYYMIAWGSLLAGGIVLAASRFSVLPRNLFTENAVQIGAVMLMALLSFAMAERINEERRRRYQAQREALDQERAARQARDESLRAQREANRVLEQRVEERTRELALANERLQQMSLTDPLTDLRNRRCFDETLQVEYNRCFRYGHSLSLIFIDIDHFKNFNDKYGHQVGDTCLQVVGRVIATSAVRDADVTARFGGEEFCILLPETDMDGARAVAERVRQRVEQERFLVSGHQVPVTVSLGVACRVPDTPEGSHQLLKEADQALYESKNQGRNRVTCSG